MTVTKKQFLPALHKSDNLKSPDFPSVEDKNYTSTILKYANLALPFPQLETNAKTIVAAINELYYTKSTVIPNPPGETPTDTLNTVKIDGTVFDIEGGGGGGHEAGRGLFLSNDNTVMNADAGVTYTGNNYVTYSLNNFNWDFIPVEGVSVIVDKFVGDGSTKQFELTHSAIELFAVLIGESSTESGTTLLDNKIIFDSAPYNGAKINVVYTVSSSGGYPLYQSNKGTYNEDRGYSDGTINLSGYTGLRIFIKQDEDYRDGEYNKHEYLELSPPNVPISTYDTYGAGTFGTSTIGGFRIFNYKLDKYKCSYYSFTGFDGSVQVRYHKDIDYAQDKIVADGTQYLFSISQPYGTINSTTVDDKTVSYEKVGDQLKFKTVDVFSGDGSTRQFILPHRAYRVTDVYVNWISKSYRLSSDGYTVTLPYDTPPVGEDNVRIYCDFYPNDGQEIVIDYTAVNNHRAYVCPIPTEEYIKTYQHQPYFHGDGVTKEFDLGGRITSIVRVKISEEVIDPSHYTLKENRILAFDFAPADGAYIVCDYTKSSGEVFNHYDTSISSHNYATGEYSHSEGLSTKALANYSHSEGYGTVANSYAHAEGNGSRALGDNGAHSEGYQCFAIGPESHAEGLETRAYGEDSHAEGKRTQAYSYGAHAEGEYTIAFGQRAHAEGSQTEAIGLYSHSEGSDTKALGPASHAEGNYTVANSEYSHTEGSYTTANHSADHAEGFQTTAEGYYSHAEGYYAKSSGYISHAEGYYTNVQGTYAHAEGASFNIGAVTPSASAGNMSHVEGFLSTTGVNAIGAHVEGMPIFKHSVYNSSTTYNTGDIVYILPSSGKTVSGTPVMWYKALRNGVQGITPGTDYTAWEWFSSSDPEDYFTPIAYYTDGYTGNGVAKSMNLSQRAIKISEVKINDVEVSNYTFEDNSVVFTEAPAAGASISIKYITSFGCTSTSQAGHAEGVGTLVDNIGGHAEGYHTHASGGYSHVEGYTTFASNWASHAEGYATKATRNYSHAEGAYSEANGYCSHAEGYDTRATGSYGHAEGYQTKSFQDYAHAEGANSEASGYYSHAEGYQTHAYSNSSHAEGYQCDSTAQSAHSEGYISKAYGSYSHAEGYCTLATADAAHSEGYQCNSYAPYAHTQNLGTQVVMPANTAIGKYNSFANNDGAIDAALIVGNGTDNDHRSNAAVIHWTGDAEFAGDITLGTPLSTTAQTVAAAINELYASGGGGSVVTVTQKVSTGTNIADITVNGTTTQLFAPTSGGSNVSVTPVQLSGNQVASITVDGTTTMLYSKVGVESTTVTADLSSGTKVATIDIDGTATDIYAPDAGDSVTVTQITTTGTHIADIEVDGVTTELYAPNAGGAVIDDNDIALDKTWSSQKINEMFFELAQRVAAIERYLWGQPVLTEEGDNRVTEDGAQRILEENEE